MTLVERIQELAADIRDKFNSLIPFGRLTSANRAQKSFLAIMQQGDGAVDLLQESLWQKNIQWWLPVAAATNQQVMGMTNGWGGSATARVLAATNIFTASRRLGLISNATANSQAYVRESSNRFIVGQGGGIGGFFVSIKFGISDAVNVPAAGLFAGVGAIPNPWGTFNPVGTANVVGVGCNSGGSNLSVFAKGATGNAHVIDLGANFPCNTSNVDLYHVILYSPSSELNRIFYRVKREGTEHVAQGELMPDVYPAASAYMVMVAMRNNHGTALAVGLDLCHMYAQTDN